MTALSFPRLYAYPKVFLYVFAIALVLLYARRGTRLNVTLLAVLTAMAFLLRHDHGVYIAIMTVCFLGLTHWGSDRLWRRMGLYTGLTVVLLVPFAIFVQTTTGLVPYVTGAQTRNIAASPLIAAVDVDIDWSAPLWVVEPPAEARVTVRWSDESNTAERRARETRYRLTEGMLVEDQTWSYVLADDDADNLGALLRDPLVSDTGGIERGTGRVEPDPWRVSLKRRLFLLRLRLAPGVFTDQNALAWFYYVTLVIPVVALGWIGAAWWSGRAERPQAAVVASAAILCLIISHTLVRGSPDSRLGDVAAPTFVLGAWLASRRGETGDSPLRSGLIQASSISLFLITLWSVWVFAGTGMTGGFGGRLGNSGLLSGPRGVWEQLRTVNRRLHRRPIDEWAEPGSTGLRALTRYIFDCTTPSDRVLVTWFEPGVFFYAERGFVGGQAYLESGWHASPADQRLTLERMRNQSVPIILGRRDREDDFQQGFPLVYDYVQSTYTLAAESEFGGELSFLVSVDPQMEPVREHPVLRLPCYR